MARIVDLNVTTYYWVPGDAAIANVNAPSVAAVSAGENISPYVVTSTAIMPSASETVNERSITDTANVVVPTIGNYEGNLVLFRDYAAGVPGTDDLLSTFTGRPVGFIVRRVGKASSTALAAADVVDVFKFMADNPQTQGGTGEGYLKLTVPLLQQGAFAVGVALAA